MAHLAFSSDSRENHVAQTGLKLLNLLSASTSQVLGLDLYAYHACIYAALGQT